MKHLKIEGIFEKRFEILNEAFDMARLHFHEDDIRIFCRAMGELQADFELPIITKIIPFAKFKRNEENYLDYYYKDPTKPFCQNIVNPKLKSLIVRFANQIEPSKRAHLHSL